MPEDAFFCSTHFMAYLVKKLMWDPKYPILTLELKDCHHLPEELHFPFPRDGVWAEGAFFLRLGRIMLGPVVALQKITVLELGPTRGTLKLVISPERFGLRVVVDFEVGFELPGRFRELEFARRSGTRHLGEETRRTTYLETTYPLFNQLLIWRITRFCDNYQQESEISTGSSNKRAQSR